MTEKPNVYECISKVVGELAKEGISKSRKAETGVGNKGYMFRGIDDVYNHLASLISEAGLCILPRVLAREVVERQSKNGATLIYVVVDVEFDFVSMHDGSKHTVRMLGEAMDTGDKATNKAMSAAYKYACLQTFCIPTEGDNDSENQTHEVKSKSVFTNAAMRNTWTKNTIQAINAAENKEELKTSLGLIRDKMNEMKASGNEYDSMACDEVKNQAQIAMTKFEQDEAIKNSGLEERQ